MESIIRGAATYLFIWLIFRITGKRTLAQITTFDAVLLLIISETTQAALTDNDNSFTNSILLILTMLGIDVLLSCIKQRFPVIEKFMDGAPLIILDRRGLRREAMTKERVDERDILHAARELQGIGRLDQIEYAILEQTGEITIVPKPGQ
jgi:uncharacterized membrane protein YcaP (DUF421 family)